MDITEDILIRTFAEAIARKEGFYKTAKIMPVPQRTNNPGCLPRWVKTWTRTRLPNRTVATPETYYPEINGFVDFPACEKPGCMHDDHPCEIGWHALREQCKTNILKRQLTFLEFFQGKRVGKKTLYMGFSPSSNKTDPYAYAKEVLAFVKRKLELSAEIEMHHVVASLVTVQIEQHRPQQRQYERQQLYSNDRRAT